MTYFFPYTLAQPSRFWRLGAVFLEIVIAQETKLGRLTMLGGVVNIFDIFLKSQQLCSPTLKVRISLAIGCSHDTADQRCQKAISIANRTDPTAVTTSCIKLRRLENFFKPNHKSPV